jgi:IMP cyclohydrolase
LGNWQSYRNGCPLLKKDETVYVGRIVAIGKTKAGLLAAMYRVSSRSFPNRQTKTIGQAVAIVPREGCESDVSRNPYIAYNCLRLVDRYAVVGNGTHVDPIADKLETGMRMRDAVISVLYGADFEHDHLNTPRIVGVVDKQSRQCALGIIRQDALFVKEMEIVDGEAFYVATYEHNFPSKDFRDGSFDAATADEACDYILGKGVFLGLERPISAACAIEAEKEFLIGCKDVSTVA